LLKNMRLRATEVRLIDDEGNRVVSVEEAQRMADEAGLDLVVVSPDADPPVVKMTDFGKFKFEAEKRAREAKKKQHTVDIKELKMGVRIDDHDYMVKMNHGRKFLQAGNKVKVSIRMRGREMQHTNLAFDLAKRFVVDLEQEGTPETNPRLEGRTLTLTFAPSKQQDKPKKEKTKKLEQPTDEPALEVPAPVEAVEEPVEEQPKATATATRKTAKKAAKSTGDKTDAQDEDA
jgi:translation initiation factor IF-3